MSNTSVRVLALVTCRNALPSMLGLTGCAGDRDNQSTGHSLDDQRNTERGYGQSTDQSLEDSRTAERVREALAAGADYKYDGIKVIASNGVVQLSGFVHTSAQRNSAGEITSRVVGVNSVEYSLTVRD